MIIFRAKLRRAIVLTVLIFGLSHCALVSKSRGPKVTVTKSRQFIGRYEVLELNFRHPANYDNPWEDVVITVDFVHQSGLSLHVGGFYFDKGLWKARIAPVLEGTWEYTYNFSAGLSNVTGTGSFICTYSDNPGFVRLNPENPYAFVLDNGDPYYPMGFGSCNGREHVNSYAEGGFGFDGPDRWKCGKGDLPPCGSADIDTYFSTYGAARFNIYRFSNRNCSFGVYDPKFGILESGNYYIVEESKWVDTLVEKLKDYGFRIIFVPINAVPTPKWTKDIGDIQDTAKMEAWKRYLKYCVDRWGSYVDIWELFNEYDPDPEWFNVIVPYMRKTDPYHHLLTSNNSHPETFFDVLTAHDYNGTPANKLDWQLASFKTWPQKYQKPFLYTEYGNRRPYSNYHPTRFRVYMWTAFTNQMGLVFWNNSFAKYATGGKGITNIYIGPEERSMAKVFFAFTSDLPANLVQVPLNISQPQKARVHALGSSNDLIAYFYHYAERPDTLSGRENDSGPLLSGLTVTLDVPGNADSAIWLDPITGKILSSQTVSSGRQTLTVPNFMIDIVLRVKKSSD